MVSVATTVDPSLLILILHTFQNPSITVLRKKQMLSTSKCFLIWNLSEDYDTDKGSLI